MDCSKALNHIELCSPDIHLYHVYGINSGDDLSSVDDILIREGYKKGRVNDNPKTTYPDVKFSKGYIEISFFVDPNLYGKKIKTISINAYDPNNPTCISP